MCHSPLPGPFLLATEACLLDQHTFCTLYARLSGQACTAAQIWKIGNKTGTCTDVRCEKTTCAATHACKVAARMSWNRAWGCRQYRPRLAMTVTMAGWHNTIPFSIACTESNQQRMPAAEQFCLPGTHSTHCTATTYMAVTYVHLAVRYTYICKYANN